MAERHFYTASMEYVYQIQEVHERKKFEFVETLLSFLFGWLTFYHQGYEVAKDFRPYMHDLQGKIQKTRTNFDDYSTKLKKRMAEVQKQYLDEPIRNIKGKKEGYLYLLEKSMSIVGMWFLVVLIVVGLFQRPLVLRGPSTTAHTTKRPKSFL